MPYSKAHHFMLLLLLLTVAAFWPSYFGRLPDAPIAHHLHGITGTLWVLLIATQSWLIHTRKIQWHRRVGKVVFVLAPLMVGAFALVTWVGAVKSTSGHPFYEMFGRALLTADTLLVFTTPLIIYLAFRYRKNVHLHSALMISTVMGLLPPILSRLFTNFVPGMMIKGPDTLVRFGGALQLAMLLTFVFAVVLYFRSRPHGWPWMLSAVITGLMYLLYATLGQTDIWAAFVQWMASMTPVVVFTVGAVLGLVACMQGWRAGRAA